ncbi:hypothetical protein MTAT_14080 [Moorella thermoacetica]|uniref:Large polyvalent protein associated domain-containing protein n=1 Tax=Neomoorella thermoacetica TaxID=1525 RepID=A0AAC9HHQ5_NEOTH|nr:hypothetical protein [Moorella thermoacetica]AOQ23823.1 hypothetical protein Maut_01375 [Moorella thermoacetica]TYL14008.1 hypothetical protein MTAT_14080 [Moorella thermoacetica]
MAADILGLAKKAVDWARGVANTAIQDVEKAASEVVDYGKQFVTKAEDYGKKFVTKVENLATKPITSSFHYTIPGGGLVTHWVESKLPEGRVKNWLHSFNAPQTFSEAGVNFAIPTSGVAAGFLKRVAPTVENVVEHFGEALRKLGVEAEEGVQNLARKVLSHGWTHPDIVNSGYINQIRQAAESVAPHVEELLKGVKQLQGADLPSLARDVLRTGYKFTDNPYVKAAFSTSRYTYSPGKFAELQNKIGNLWSNLVVEKLPEPVQKAKQLFTDWMNTRRLHRFNVNLVRERLLRELPNPKDRVLVSLGDAFVKYDDLLDPQVFRARLADSLRKVAQLHGTSREALTNIGDILQHLENLPDEQLKRIGTYSAELKDFKTKLFDRARKLGLRIEHWGAPSSAPKEATAEFEGIVKPEFRTPKSDGERLALPGQTLPQPRQPQKFTVKSEGALSTLEGAAGEAPSVQPTSLVRWMRDLAKPEAIYEEYIPHYYTKEGLSHIQEVLSQRSASAVTHHMNPRTLSTAAAIGRFGPTEMILDAAHIYPRYFEELSRAIDAQEFLNRLLGSAKELKLLLPQELAERRFTGDLPRDVVFRMVQLPKELRFRRPLNVPLGEGETLEGVLLQIKDAEGNILTRPYELPHTLMGGFYVPEEVAKYLEKVFERDASNLLWSVYNWLRNRSTGMIMAVPFVHAGNVVRALRAISWDPTGVLSSANAWIKGRRALGKALEEGYSDIITRGLKAGLNIEGTNWEIGRTFATEAAGKPVGKESLLERWNNILWEYTVKPVQIGLFDTLSKRFVAKGVAQEAADRMAADLTNHLLGTVSTEEWGRTARELSKLFFAPRWFPSRWAMIAKAVNARLGSFSPEERKLLSGAYRWMLVKGIINSAILTAALNYAITGRLPTENEPEQWLKVDVTPIFGLTPEGKKQYFDVTGWWMDYFKPAFKRLRGELPTAFLVDKIHPVARDIGEAITGIILYPTVNHAKVTQWLRSVAESFTPAGVSVDPQHLSNLLKPEVWFTQTGLGRITPGPSPKSPPGTAEYAWRVKNFDDNRASNMQILRWIYGNRLGAQNVADSLDILGLPIEERNKIIREVYSPESWAFLQNKLRRPPTREEMWAMRHVLMQPDKQDAWNKLFDRQAVNYLQKALGKVPTVEDGIKYVTTIEDLHAGKNAPETLGKGAYTRRYNGLFQGWQKGVRAPRAPRPPRPKIPKPY